MLRTAELDYELPESAIAREPSADRSAARLMVVRPGPGQVEHRRVADLPELLNPKDRLVFNATRVLPARLEGVVVETGGRVEGLWLEADRDELGIVWTILLRSKRPRPGRHVSLERAGEPTGIELELIEPGGPDTPGGAWHVRPIGPRSEGRSTPELLDLVGRPGLPPYILAARRRAHEAVDRPEDTERYQTVYAASETADESPSLGSVAAPTAGLHFTEPLLAELDAKGIQRAQALLHVGPGTFKWVETETVEDHPMHAEWCSLAGVPTAWLTHKPPGRLVCVGTTSARTIESFAGLADRNEPMPEWLSTNLLITPGYQWLGLDGLLTNFHLPRSTLMAMVAALLPGGAAELVSLYKLAIAEGYRFYSFGDAMLVLPDA